MKAGKRSFQFNRVWGRVEEVCVCGLSFFGPKNKICLAWSLHLSLRNNTNSISPCRVIRNVIYRFCARICTPGNCFVVPQQRWHGGLGPHSRQHHSPFQCVPTLAKSMLASGAVMEMCSLTKHIMQSEESLCAFGVLDVEKSHFVFAHCYMTDSRSASELARPLNHRLASLICVWFMSV